MTTTTKSLRTNVRIEVHVAVAVHGVDASRMAAPSLVPSYVRPTATSAVQKLRAAHKNKNSNNNNNSSNKKENNNCATLGLSANVINGPESSLHFFHSVPFQSLFLSTFLFALLCTALPFNCKLLCVHSLVTFQKQRTKHKSKAQNKNDSCATATATTTGLHLGQGASKMLFQLSAGRKREREK